MGMNTDAVQRLYVAYFNRPADPASLAVYEGMLASDRAATQAELQTLAEQYFSPSAEYQNVYSSLSNAEIINTLYQNLFGRDAEPAGLLSWTGKLNSGEETVASIALQLSFSAQGTDADSITAKISAANAFTDEVAGSSANIIGFSGNDAAASARTWLATVTDSASSTAAIAGVSTAVSDSIAAQNPAAGPDAAQTFTATTGLDTFTGGSGNDTVNALPTTLTVGDTVDGGAGTDTLTLTTSLSANTALDGFNTSNLESFNVSMSDSDTGNAETLTLNMSSAAAGTVQVSGLGTTVANDTVTFNNLAGGTTVSMRSATDLNTTANFVAAATAGTADAVSVELAGVSRTAATDVTLTIGTGFETLNIDSSGSASRLDQITTTTATAINITGNANLTVDTDLDATTVTVDASAFTGNLSIDTSNDAAPNTAVAGVDVADITVTGGSGNDNIDVSQNAANNEIVVDGGAGNDTVTIGAGVLAAGTATLAQDTLGGGAGTDILVSTSAGLAAQTAAGTVGVSGFETLQASDALGGATITVANVQATGVETVNVAAGGTGTIVGQAGSLNVTLGAALAGGALTLTDTGTATTDSVSLSNVATTAVNVGASQAITVNGYETLNIDGTAVGATAQVFGAVTMTADTGGTSTLNVTGADPVTIGAFTGTTIDASGMTAQAAGTTTFNNATATTVTTITGSPGDDVLRGDAASTINGGAGADTITGGTGNDTLNGGAGADGITTGTGNDTVNGGDGNDTITAAGNLSALDAIDGGAGTDTLSVTNASLTALQALTISQANAFNTNLNSVEVLSVTDALNQGTFDLGYVDGVSTVALGAGTTGAETINGLSSGNTLQLSATGNTVTPVVNNAGTGAADELTIALTANAGTDVGAATVANVETLTIDVSEATASATVQAATIGLTLSQTTAAAGGSGAAQTVNVVGTESLTIDTAISAGTVDASGMGTRLATAAGLTMGAGLTATAAIAGQTITGSGGVDTLLGSTGGDTISGGAGADTINGSTGADTIDGGAGLDTYTTAGMVGANIEGTGTGTSSGVVVNLGATALSNVTVTNNGAQNISGQVTTVAPNTAAYLYGASSVNNSAVVDTLTSIENVTMNGNGANFIMGSAAANAITGGTGVDTVDGGAGGDTISGLAGNDTLDGNTGADTITGGGGNDTITLGGSDSAIDTVVMEATAAANGADTITEFEAGTDQFNVDALTAGTAVTAWTGSITVTAGLVYFYSFTDAGAATAVETASQVATVLTANAVVGTQTPGDRKSVV